MHKCSTATEKHFFVATWQTNEELMSVGEQRKSKNSRGRRPIRPIGKLLTFVLVFGHPKEKGEKVKANVSDW